MIPSPIKISVIIPVMNEAPNLVPLYQELTPVMEGVGQAYEILFIDDGSHDRSRAIIEALCEGDDRVKAVFFRKNRGQTAAFEAGFHHARGEVIVTLDADLQNDPSDIPHMLQKLDEGFDLVAGWRKERRDGFILRTFPSKIANSLIRTVTHTKLHDLGCSLKVYRKEFTDELRLFGEMHRFIGVLMEGLGARVCEVPVKHRARAAGESKYNLSRTFKVLLDLLTVWFMRGYNTKPIYVFGGAGGVMMLLSSLLFSYVLWEKLALQIWVHRNPIFLLGIFISLVGVQFIALGLLAEIMVRVYFTAGKVVPYAVAKRINFPATHERAANNSVPARSPDLFPN